MGDANITLLELQNLLETFYYAFGRRGRVYFDLNNEDAKCHMLTFWWDYGVHVRWLFDTETLERDEIYHQACMAFFYWGGDIIK